MNKYVLDASALLALLNDETGAEIVQEVLPDAVISSINFSEVVTRLALFGMPVNTVHDTLDILGLEIIPFDATLAYDIGDLAIATKHLGLSIGDRACLALAKNTERTAVTADKIWSKVNTSVTIKLIR